VLHGGLGSHQLAQPRIEARGLHGFRLSSIEKIANSTLIIRMPTSSLNSVACASTGACIWIATIALPRCRHLE
jgi:hypothetical protein